MNSLQRTGRFWAVMPLVATTWILDVTVAWQDVSPLGWTKPALSCRLRQRWEQTASRNDSHPQRMVCPVPGLSQLCSCGQLHMSDVCYCAMAAAIAWNCTELPVLCVSGVTGCSMGTR